MSEAAVVVFCSIFEISELCDPLYFYEDLVYSAWSKDWTLHFKETHIGEKFVSTKTNWFLEVVKLSKIYWLLQIVSFSLFIMLLNITLVQQLKTDESKPRDWHKINQYSTVIPDPWTRIRTSNLKVIYVKGQFQLEKNTLFKKIFFYIFIYLHNTQATIINSFIFNWLIAWLQCFKKFIKLK